MNVEIENNETKTFDLQTGEKKVPKITTNRKNQTIIPKNKGNRQVK